MITITIDGIPKALDSLTKLSQALDVDEIVDGLQALMLHRIRERYLDNVAPDGTPWPPSAIALKQGRNTLIDTGTLFGSIQGYDEGRGERSIGTDIPYGVYHNYGTRKLPMRKFLGFGDEDVSAAEMFMIRRIEAALK